MLEQSIDTKIADFAKDSTVYGSPVKVNAINSVNPETSKLMADIQRYNKNPDLTVTRPYIEDFDITNITKPVMLKSESLRVDVPGSIKTKAVLAPGSVAANIRRRG